MNDNKVTIIGFLFLVLCLGLVGGVWYLDGRLRELRAEYDQLEQRRANLVQDRDNLRAQAREFREAFATLEAFNVRAATSEMDFYAQIQQEIERHSRNNEIAIISAHQNPVVAGRGSQSLVLRGNYYAFMRILAAWRNLNTTVRVAQLSVSISGNPPVLGEIQASVTLEAIINPN